MIKKYLMVLFAVGLMGMWSSSIFAGPVTTNSSISKSKMLGIGLGGSGLSSGITGRYYLSQKNAVQATIGGSRWGSTIGAQYVQSMGQLWTHEVGELAWEVGGGVSMLTYRFASDSSTVIGVDGFAGLNWRFLQVPIEVILSIGPAIYVGDYYGGFYLNGGGAAVRWYF